VNNRLALTEEDAFNVPVRTTFTYDNRDHSIIA